MKSIFVSVILKENFMWSVRPSARPSIRPSVRPSVHPSVYLCTHWSSNMTVYLYPSVHQFVYLFIHLSICQSRPSIDPPSWSFSICLWLSLALSNFSARDVFSFSSSATLCHTSDTVITQQLTQLWHNNWHSYITTIDTVITKLTQL